MTLKDSQAMKFFLVLLFLWVFSGLAYADSVAKAEAWFNGLTTYRADFTQISSDGSSAEGVFSLRRPYRSRFDYAEPVPITLITTQTWLHVDDSKQGEVTSYPVSETPLRFILTERVRLRLPDIETRTHSQDGVTVVMLEQSSGLGAGKIRFEFNEVPFELRRWVLTDANGVETSVFLSNAIKGLDLPARLFVPTTYPGASSN